MPNLAAERRRLMITMETECDDLQGDKVRELLGSPATHLPCRRNFLSFLQRKKAFLHAAPKTRFLNAGLGGRGAAPEALDVSRGGKRWDIAASLPAIQSRCKASLNLHSCAPFLHQTTATSPQRPHGWTTSAP
jgi:hypothetical protein